MSKLFIDTNIFVSTFDYAKPTTQAKAIAALIAARDTGHQFVVSTQVLQELYNVLTGKLKVDKPVAKHEMLLLQRYELVLMDPAILGSAADPHAEASLSFWDALIIAAAQFAKCDQLWSEDLQSGREFGSLKIVNPLV